MHIIGMESGDLSMKHTDLSRIPTITLSLMHAKNSPDPLVPHAIHACCTYLSEARQISVRKLAVKKINCMDVAERWPLASNDNWLLVNH